MEMEAQCPSLANFGDRETIANYLDVTDENLKAWIQDPQSLKQGNNMPAYPDLSDEELDALVAYLNQLEKLDPETKEGLERD
ncbi:cytochrome c family protein [Geomicrobium sp. JCM 19055]|uniref:c-type cytochrome n=1 Tax=Geomicrobium sp. JCM 19055 TaxID=1460649 RepID=UPI00351CA6BE